MKTLNARRKVFAQATLALFAAAMLAASGARAQAQDAAASPTVAKVPRELRIHLAWQIALEAADFSPGIIDGAFKTKGNLALKEYAARYFPGLDPFDVKVYEALKVDVDGAVTSYTVSPDDAAQVGGPLPDDWNEKARLAKLNYESLVDCIGEKFHCTRALLQTLNPGAKLDAMAPGQQLVVPNIRPFPVDNRVTVTKRAGDTGYVSVDLTQKTIRIFDKSGGQIALFHCSIAKDKAKLPDRDAKISAIAAPYPGYQFNPSMWPEVHNVHSILQIPPGARNPVGLSWCSLDLPGYGIHGVPKPELIGKTGSHGCFRLTNWDALKFAGLVKEGMTVKIVNPETNPQ